MKITFDFRKKHAYLWLILILGISSVVLVLAVPPNPGHSLDQIEGGTLIGDSEIQGDLKITGNINGWDAMAPALWSYCKLKYGDGVVESNAKVSLMMNVESDGTSKFPNDIVPVTGNVICGENTATPTCEQVVALRRPGEIFSNAYENDRSINPSCTTVYPFNRWAGPDYSGLSTILFACCSGT